MSNEATAVTAVESATTSVEQKPEFNSQDTSTWSSEQKQEWVRTGTVTPPKKADSATAKDSKDTTKADSSTAEKDKKAAAPSDSATDKDKPHLRTKEDTERRFQELLDRVRKAEERAEAAERRTSEKRESKQESQPAAEVYKPLDEKEYFQANPKATYEDFVRAAAKHEAKWEVKQEIAAERQRLQQEAAQKELNARVEEAKKRYPEYESRVKPAVKSIVEDQQVPFAVKAVLNDSPVFVDLVYVLSEPAALADLIQTAKTNPAAAIRKIVLTEQLVQAELAKTSASDGKDKGGESSGEAKRDDSGKFVAKEDSSKEKDMETKARAKPKPPAEVGGRSSATEEADKAAARSGNFAAFEAEMNRKARASAS